VLRLPGAPPARGPALGSAAYKYGAQYDRPQREEPTYSKSMPPPTRMQGSSFQRGSGKLSGEARRREPDTWLSRSHYERATEGFEEYDPSSWVRTFPLLKTTRARPVATLPRAACC
jgi:hypothetical protein